VRVLIIEDEKITRISLTNTLETEGYDVVAVEEGATGINLIEKKTFDVVVTDLRLPGKNGIEVLQKIKQTNPACEVIVITAYATVETAVEALKMGAYDYITKPLSPDKFLAMMRKIHQYYTVVDENQQLKKRLEIFENKILVGNSAPMQELMQKVRSVAVHNYTVLIQGESGTGKELIANALHYYSTRKDKPFIPINCATFPESLLESELFGHEKGSFSGAIQRHIGYFERADKGTIFIDDIDDLPLQLQVKLLRVLQERQFVRVGGTDTISVDVRIICATKIDLRERVRENLFREDLYYRLHIIPLYIPPLRERCEDIPVLISHFFDKLGARDKLKLLNEAFYKKLMNYNWPGNVRELENTVERIVATSDINIPLNPLSSTRSTTDQPDNGESTEGQYPPFDEYIKEKEMQIIGWALRQTNNNVTKAARLLQIPRGTLRSKLEKYHWPRANR